MTINEMKHEYGSFEMDGKTFVLVQQAYIDGAPGEDCYRALAIVEGDEPDDMGSVDCYSVTFEILDSAREYWANGGDDEGDACDWDHPSDVSLTGGYIPAEDRCC